jgi:hypothetical protein
VHWLCRAFWTFSIFSAFLSAAFACKHTTFINAILLDDDPEVKQWFQEGGLEGEAHPPLSVVLLLSGTKMFFDSAMISYAVGLGIYLGSVWLQNLDPHSSPDDSRSIFIVFLVSAAFCFSAFSLLEFSPHPKEQDEWKAYKKLLNKEWRPCLCVNRVGLTREVRCVTPSHSHPGGVGQSPKKAKPSHGIFACGGDEDQDQDEAENRGQGQV